MNERDQIDPATIRVAVDQARQSAQQINDLQAANARTIRTLETALYDDVKGPFNDPSPLPPTATEHRRLHRRGTLSPIKTDLELQAFIRARIPTLTYAEIAAEVAANFPPDRRTSVSALSRWWSSLRDGGKVQSQDIR